jgi:hypothetical protein
VRYGTRSKRLEQDVGRRYPEGRCRTCLDWSPLHFSGISFTAAKVLAGKGITDGPCCPQCGWAPQVAIEVIIESREKKEALDRFCEQRRTKLEQMS